MTIENVVLWYEENVNYKLTVSFLKFMIKIGIINNDIDLDFLNSYLLEKYSDDFIIENGKYKIKQNRIPIIFKHKDEAVEEVSQNEDIKPKENKTSKKKKSKKNGGKIILYEREKNKNSSKKFKIENINGNKMKLVKL